MFRQLATARVTTASLAIALVGVAECSSSAPSGVDHRATDTGSTAIGSARTSLPRQPARHQRVPRKPAKRRPPCVSV